MRLHLTLLCFLWILGGGPLILRAQIQTKMSFDLKDQIPFDQTARFGTLKNGFQYIIRKDTNTTKVLMTLITKAGYNHEDDDQLELSHLLEHMPFVGTLNFTNARDFFVTRGVSFGDDMNAHIETDLTKFYIQLDKHNVSLIHDGFRFLRDCAGNITLDSARIDNERGVVLGELRRATSLASEIREQFESALLPNSKYASRRFQDYKDNISKFNQKSLFRYYRKWYRPDNQAIIVVGNIDIFEIEKTIDSLFSDLLLPTSPKSLMQLPPSTFGSKINAVVVKHKGLTSLKIQIHMKDDFKIVRTYEDYKREFLGYMFAKMANIRFKRIIAENPQSRMSADYQERNGGVGPDFSDLITTVSASTEQDAYQCFKLVITEMHRIKTFGFTDREISVAKNAMLKEISNSQINLKNDTDDFINYLVYGSAAPGQENLHKLSKLLVTNLNRNDINDQVQHFLNPAAVTITAEVPEIEGMLINSDALVKTFSDIMSISVSPLQEDIGIIVELDSVQLSREIPAFATQRFSEIGITKVNLSNGVNILVKETPHSNHDPEINILAVSPGGLSALAPEKRLSGILAPQLVMASGICNLNGQDLKSYLEDKQIFALLNIKEYETTINISTDLSHLNNALQVIVGSICSPKFDTVAFNELVAKKQYSTSNINKSAPMKVFNNAIKTQMNSISVLEQTYPQSEWKGVTRKISSDVYREVLTNTGNFTYIIAGAFKTDKILPSVIKHIATLPNKNISTKPNFSRDVIQKGIKSTILCGEDLDKGAVTFKIHGRYKYLAANNIKLELIEILLKEQLIEVLRNQLGGTYEVVVTLEYEKRNSGVFTFTISFECAPNSSKTLAEATLTVIKQLTQKNLLSEKLASAKDIKRNAIKRDTLEVNFWLKYLKNQVTSYEPITDFSKKTSLIKSISPDDLSKFGRTIFTEQNINTFILLPENMSVK